MENAVVAIVPVVLPLVEKEAADAVLWMEVRVAVEVASEMRALRSIHSN